MDEVATAKVTINVGRGKDSQVSNDGKKDTKNIGQTAKYMKSLFKIVKKQGGALAAVAGVVALATGSMTSIVSAGGVSAFNHLDNVLGDVVDVTKTALDHEEQPGGYVKIWEDGEEKVARINERTGLIQEIITMREAAERGILNETNDIKNSMQSGNAIYKIILGYFDTYKGALILTNENASKVLDQSSNEIKIRNEIQTELEIKRDRLAAENSSEAYQKYTHYTSGGIPYSADEQGTFWDAVYGQQSNENNNTWADIYNDTKSAQQPSFVENIYPWDN